MRGAQRRKISAPLRCGISRTLLDTVSQKESKDRTSKSEATTTKLRRPNNLLQSRGFYGDKGN